MNSVLWITQLLLSITFIWAGSMKLVDPSELPFPWVKNNEILVKLTGVLDLLAGIGLVLPALLRIYPQLTIFSAYGTILLMSAAIVFHVARGEASQIGFNVFVMLAAIFIAWGRQKKVPISAK
ncbi:MAG TPA: DoxX family protein [Bacteroidia bacterium]